MQRCCQQPPPSSSSNNSNSNSTTTAAQTPKNSRENGEDEDDLDDDVICIEEEEGLVRSGMCSEKRALYLKSVDKMVSEKEFEILANRKNACTTLLGTEDAIL